MRWGEDITLISYGIRESMLDIAGLTYKEHLNRGGTLEVWEVCSNLYNVTVRCGGL